MGRFRLLKSRPRRRRCVLCQQALPTKPKAKAKTRRPRAGQHKRPAW